MQNAQTGGATFTAPPPTVTLTSEQFVSGTNPDGTTRYVLCKPGADCVTTGSLTATDLADYQRMGYTQTFDQAKVQQNANFGAGTSCTGTDFWFSPATCLWRGFMSVLGAGLVWIISWLVVAAGMFFDWAIRVTITDFTQLFYTAGVSQAVAEVWAAVRDLGNIFIIGLFVFIAISIILGLQEYGQKKLIARVIIVAILINFSFLFTHIAINTSNLFASQIVASKAQLLQPGSAGSLPLAGNVSASGGIAATFLKFAGAETLGDTWDALSRVAENNQSGWVALLHGLVVFALLGLAAVVLFYGAFLLLARGIILLFLLMTSAFAFATYLSPTLAESDYGFKGWKDQLLRNVILAPAMMIFLWAALSLANQIGDKSGTLGSLISNPQGQAGIGALFSYFMIIGLLFGALKLSSSLSGATGRLAAVGGLLPAAIMARGVVAPVARWTIGGRAAASGHALEQGMKNRAKKMATLDLDDPTQKKEYQKLRGEWASMSRQKGRRDFLAKSSFDLMNTKAMQKAGAAAGLGGALAGKSDKSYEKSSHEQVEAGLKEAMKAVITDQQGAELARKKHEDPTTGEVAIERQHKDNMEILKVAKETANAAKEGAGLTKKLADHQADISSATRDKADLTTKFAKGEVTETEHRTAMTAINKRIEDAQKKATEVSGLMRDIEAPVRDAQQNVNRSFAALKEFENRTREEGKSIQKRSVETAKDLGPAFAGGTGIRSLYAGTSWHPDSHVVHELREKIGSKGKGDRLARAAREKEKKEDTVKDDHAHPPPAAGGGDAHPPKAH